jgi:hypothetical protein
VTRINCPTAFALVFGALPAFVFTVAVLAVYPVVGWPLLAIGTTAFWAVRKRAHRNALAARAAVEYPRNAALVFAPLPDAPTVPRLRAVR